MSWWNEDDDGLYDQFDESDARVRPGRGSRPRTKTRPRHDDAVAARVLAVTRGRFTVLVDDEREVVATRARELRRQPIVTGDLVDVVGDTSGREGTLGRIVRIHDRTTVLRRSADDSDDVERIIVANVDQMLIVAAAADPEPRVRLIDRYLVAALDAGIAPLLCMTKTDLADPGAFLQNFAGLGLSVFRSGADGIPLDELHDALAGRRTVAVGHSGVGKSTLVNALVPGAARAVGHVNAVTGRGRHTSSSTLSLRLASRDGWIIDTPGVRSFGLGHVRTESVLAAFSDLESAAERCPRGCTHLATAPDCALDEALATGALGSAGAGRVDSFRRLLTAVS